MHYASKIPPSHISVRVRGVILFGELTRATTGNIGLEDSFASNNFFLDVKNIFSDTADEAS
jgi:hypothetical protein